MEPTFLFYDIETSGLNPCFDQVLQFAAIRTDLSLHELERHEFLIKINADVTPHPEAMATHGISLEQLSQGESEYEAIKKIHVLLNQPGTISLGYNTLGFDDEFLRFSFYRNLLTPYTHQYAHSCGRMDLYPMTILYHLFKPNVIQWPNINGRLSLKLENINKANQLVEGQAHLAMVDVEVTLALARIFYEDRRMWDYLCNLFIKQKDAQRLRKLNEGIIVSGKLGYQNQFLAPALSLGEHNVYRNQRIWLRLDDPQLSELNEENIDEKSFVFRKKPGDIPIILPSERRFLERIQSERLELANQNSVFLEKNKSLMDALKKHHLNYTYPEVKGIDADAALYTIPFSTPEEENLFHRFHESDPDKKNELIALFKNPTRQEQAIRIMGRHFPSNLSAPYQAIFSEHIAIAKQGKQIDYKGNHATGQ